MHNITRPWFRNLLKDMKGKTKSTPYKNVRTLSHLSQDNTPSFCHSHPENNFTTMVIVFRMMRGSLMYWHAWMSPINWPLSEFLLPPGISAKVHPLGARNRSSFSMAKAFAKSRRPSSSVQNPIFCRAYSDLSGFSDMYYYYLKCKQFRAVTFFCIM